jgi:gas vesicle protein
MDYRTALLTALGGVAAGYLLGILFAPGKGTETRNRLTEKSHEYTEYLADKIDDILESVSQPFENSDNELNQIGRKAKAEADRITEEVKSNMQ